MIWLKTVLVWGRLEIFVDSEQNQTTVLSQLGREGRCKVPTEVSLPGYGIVMINEDFHIAGILQAVTRG